MRSLSASVTVTNRPTCRPDRRTAPALRQAVDSARRTVKSAQLLRRSLGNRRRTITPPTVPDSQRRVTTETSTIAAKADGNDHAAGCSRNPRPATRHPTPGRAWSSTSAVAQTAGDTPARTTSTTQQRASTARSVQATPRAPLGTSDSISGLPQTGGGDMTGPAETTRRPPRHRTAEGAGVGPRRTASPTGFAPPPRMTTRRSR